MLIPNLIAKVKLNLGIADTTRDLDIKDILQEVMNYCNLPYTPIEVYAEQQGITLEEAYALIDLPVELEPYIRRKVQSIINYEAENGTSAVFDVKSIREGDTTIAYNVDDSLSRETIYGLSPKDKQALQRFRRTRK